MAAQAAQKESERSSINELAGLPWWGVCVRWRAIDFCGWCIFSLGEEQSLPWQRVLVLP